jgi:hypothetical protein
MNAMYNNIRKIIEKKNDIIDIKENIKEVDEYESSDLVSESESEQNNYLDEFKIKIISIIKKYNKKKYRDIFTDIGKNKIKFKKLNYTHNLIFTHFQFRCLFKIIDQKFNKYYRDKNIKGIDNCFELTEKLLETFTNDIERLPKESQKEQYEYLNYFYLVHLYNNALLKKHNNNIPECLCYLSIADKLIRKTSKDITYPRIWRIIIKIYLFLTSLLISRKDFYSAKNYLNSILQICYKDFVSSIYINQKHEKDNDEKEMHQIFLNMMIAFYQLGCINENTNHLENAETSYEQANYISNYYLYNRYPEISFLMKNVSTRMRNHYFTFKTISKLDINIENFVNPKKKVIKTLSSIGEEKRMKHYQKIENYVDNIHFSEIDDDHVNLLTEVGKKPKSQKIETMVKNLHLLTYLTSEEFKPTITDFKTMDINKLDLNLKRTIQKKILSIKSDDIHHLKTERIRNKNKICLSERSNNEQLSEQRKLKRNSNGSLKFKTINTSSINIHMRHKSFIHSKKHYNTKPYKIDYDKYIFNNNYIKKNKYLVNQIDKEYKFHKDILNSKKFETIYVEPFNIEKVKSETDLFYNIELDKNLKILKDKNKSIKTEESQRKYNMLIEKMKYSLKERSCKSLNIKQAKKYKEFLKKFDKRQSQNTNDKLLKILSINKYMDKYYKTNGDEEENDNYKIINEEIIEKLGDEMQKLDKKEKNLLKIKMNFQK